MNNDNKFQEAVEAGVKEISKEIPVRVQVSRLNDTPFEYTVSIDDVGQIILTPLSKDMSFMSADTEDTVDYDTPIVDQETKIIDEFANYKEEFRSIVINATMLAVEDSSTAVSADIDEIGQCVLYPINKDNVFTTAVKGNSLNLVTENLGVEYEDYFNYRLLNPGNGWYVKDPEMRLIGQGFASKNAAKIFVCETELSKLRSISESAQESEDVPSKMSDESHDNNEGETSEPTEPQVTAELVEQSIDSSAEDKIATEDIDEVLSSITEAFTCESGAIRCDTEDEKLSCVETLNKHYTDVSTRSTDEGFIIEYMSKPSLNEAMDEEERATLIIKFLKGEVPLFSDTGIPVSDYIHLDELDTNGYEYYYDKESGSIVSYPERDNK